MARHSAELPPELPPPSVAGYRKEDKRYWCNCNQRCHGIMQVRSRKTFGNHSKYRQADSPGQGQTTLPTSTQPISSHSVLTRALGLRQGYNSDSDEDEDMQDLLEGEIRRASGEEEGNRMEGLDEQPEGSTTPSQQPSSMDSIPAQAPTPRPVDEDRDTDTDRDSDSEDEDGPPLIATLEDMKIALSYVEWIREARHEDTGMTKDDIQRLLNPPQCLLDLSDDPDLELCIGLYVDLGKTSQKAYDRAMSRLRARFKDQADTVTFYSYGQVRAKIRELTGISEIKHDMCIKTCMAYTGPLSALRNCMTCKEARYRVVKGKDVPRQQFYTIPVGSQLQAMARSKETIKLLRYRRDETKKVLDECVATLPDGSQKITVPAWGDFIHGRDYINSVLSEDIRDDDMVLMLSIDGAQLYESKKSDVWIYIWVLMDLPPSHRYKKKFVMPGGFIPGPNKPKNVESFLFPGIQHLAVLQKEGLPIWDPTRVDPELEDPNEKATYTTHPFLHSCTADGPGLCYLHCRNGHQGYYGCRHYCPIPGRRFDQKSNTYYPALLKPYETLTPESNHPDIPLSALYDTTSPSRVQDYEAKLKLVVESSTMANYIENRRDTGISKPSLFSGLPESHRFNILSMFPADLMHLTALNITDVIMGLFRGTIDVGPGDDTSTWDWMVLTDDEWKKHGELVSSFKRYLSSSIDRPPRDPAKKINSGYKAKEFLTYVYGMLPALLYGVLPEPYYSNFCKLVWGVRIVTQRNITTEELQQAHRAFTEFVQEFEQIYVQRKASRLHFIRQCIHNLIHLCPETVRAGPLNLLAQWLMERTVGNLGEEIKQPSNPYKNLSERGLRRAQTNAVISMLDLEPEDPPPEGSTDFGGGYFLMNPTARSVVKMTENEQKAFLEYALVQEPGFEVSKGRVTALRRGRLRLPTEQVGRTAWKENEKSADAPLRISRMVKIVEEYEDNGTTKRDVYIGEVAYFFEAELNGKIEGLAMVSLCSDPNTELLERSHNTLWVTSLESGKNMCCIPVDTIVSVVSLLPFAQIPGTMFLFENLGLDVAYLDSSTFLSGGPEDVNIDT